MLIERVRCPRCGEDLIVDRKLWVVGTVALRCAACAEMFDPEGSPGTGSVPEAANASVEIAIWGAGEPHAGA